MAKIKVRAARGRQPRASVPILSTPLPPIVGDAAHADVEPRLLTDLDVHWVWHADALTAVGGGGFDESADVSGSLPLRTFVDSPFTVAGRDPGNVMKIRCPVPGEAVAPSSVPSHQVGSLTYGQYMRRRFSQFGLAPRRHAHFRYLWYVGASFWPGDGGKLPSLYLHDPSLALSAMSSSATYHDNSAWPGMMWIGPSTVNTPYPGTTYSGDSNQDHIRFQPYMYAKQAGSVTMTSASVSGGQRGTNVKLRTGLDQDPAAAQVGGSGTAGGCAPSTNPYFYLARGTVHTIEQEITVNDSGVANGVYRIWLDGTLVYNRQDIKWVADAYNAIADINCLMLDCFYGGPSGSYITGEHYFSDFVISDAYVGVPA